VSAGQSCRAAVGLMHREPLNPSHALKVAEPIQGHLGMVAAVVVVIGVGVAVSRGNNNSTVRQNS